MFSELQRKWPGPVRTVRLPTLRTISGSCLATAVSLTVYVGVELDVGAPVHVEYSVYVFLIRQKQKQRFYNRM